MITPAMMTRGLKTLAMDQLLQSLRTICSPYYTITYHSHALFESAVSCHFTILSFPTFQPSSTDPG